MEVRNETAEKRIAKGIIIKGIAGFYYVDTGDAVYRSKARGIFRKRGKTPLVGDRVTIEIQEDGDAWVTEIQTRRNAFIRPPVANIETLCLVLAAKEPETLPLTADRFLVMAEAKRADIIIAWNKEDLAEGTTQNALSAIYEPLYPVFRISAKNGTGIDALKAALKGKITALAGPSGVGKSTLINVLSGREIAETGETSARLGRGKQTTRASELYAIEGEIHLFDTPGFTSFSAIDASKAVDEEIEAMEAELTERELGFCFPEFEPYLGSCKFDNCLHFHEPDCAVRKALLDGKIAPSRYESYVTILEELRAKKRY